MKSAKKCEISEILRENIPKRSNFQEKKTVFLPSAFKNLYPEGDGPTFNEKLFSMWPTPRENRI